MKKLFGKKVFKNKLNIPTMMKFVATKSILKNFSEIKNLASYIEEGVILLPETSFDSQIVGTNLEELTEYTSNYPVTIIGEKDSQVHILKKGKIISAQVKSSPFNNSLYKKTNQFYNISYNPKINVRALIRICSDAIKPYKGKEKADLLLIPSCGINWGEKIEELLEVHKESLKPDALIIHSGAYVELYPELGNQFIYSLKHKSFVGIKKEISQKHNYIIYAH